MLCKEVCIGKNVLFVRAVSEPQLAIDLSAYAALDAGCQKVRSIDAPAAVAALNLAYAAQRQGKIVLAMEAQGSYITAFPAGD